MKSAFIVIKTQKGIYEEDFSLMRIFRKNGVVFNETRVFSYDFDEACKGSFTALKKDFDLVVVVAEKICISAVLQSVTGVYAENSYQNAGNGIGAFCDKEKLLFLLPLSSDNTVSYVNEVAVPMINKTYGIRLDRVVIRSVGASRERVISLLAKASEISQGKIRVTHERRYDEEIIEIAYGESVSKMLIDDIVRLFVDGLGDTVYALDDTPLDERLIEILKLRRRKISVAESFTGGAIAKRLTSVSGASEVYFEGVNTYNEYSKIKRLGVSNYTLKTVGAVSDQTAYEMATGLIATGDCDISIATTGLAGPKTDKSGLPVGVCYIAIGTKEKVFVYRYKFDGTRQDITETAINYALYLAYKHLKSM